LIFSFFIRIYSKDLILHINSFGQKIICFLWFTKRIKSLTFDLWGMPVVWVVDDRERVTNSLARYIGRKMDGCLVLPFYNATDPIDRLESGYIFDIAIVDVELPHPGGEFVIDYMRKKHPDGRIIAISGYDISEVRGKVTKADDFVHKGDGLAEKLISLLEND